MQKLVFDLLTVHEVRVTADCIMVTYSGAKKNLNLE